MRTTHLTFFQKIVQVPLSVTTSSVFTFGEIFPVMKKVDSEASWKSKYYSSLEELEQKEKDWEEMEVLLRMATSRMSLAADGISKVVDYRLSELRDQLRKKISKQKLNQVLKSITAIIELLEKESGSATLLPGWKWLDQIVQALHFPKKYQPQVKALRRQISYCESDTQMQPVVQNFIKLLEKVLEHSTGGEQKESAGGLFGYLKRGQRSEAQPAQHDRSGGERPGPESPGPVRTASCQSGADVIYIVANQIMSALEEKGRIKDYIDKARDVEDGQALLQLAEEFAGEIQRVWKLNTEPQGITANAAMNQLLDRFCLPPVLEKNIQKLRERLAQDIPAAAWPEVISRVAALVQYMHQQTQQEKRDLETFLAQVTERLKLLDNSLQAIDKERITSHQNNLKFNADMDEQVTDIRNTVSAASNLEKLKIDVANRLDGITRHMGLFLQQEGLRDQQAKQHIADLSSRLSQMEKEANDLKEKVARQRELALIDKLTGIPNRMAYDERLDQEYRRWRRFHDHLSLALFDIDYFKKVNDNYGHKAGDRVLAAIATILKKRIRETDFIARLGGEEFALLMVGADLDNSLRVADKLRKAVEDCGFHFRGQKVLITVSAGVAEFVENDTPDDVFERADKALYVAKNSGRNRCEKG